MIGRCSRIFGSCHSEFGRCHYKSMAHHRPLWIHSAVFCQSCKWSCSRWMNSWWRLCSLWFFNKICVEERGITERFCWRVLWVSWGVSDEPLSHDGEDSDRPLGSTPSLVRVYFWRRGGNGGVTVDLTKVPSPLLGAPTAARDDVLEEVLVRRRPSLCFSSAARRGWRTLLLPPENKFVIFSFLCWRRRKTLSLLSGICWTF